MKRFALLALSFAALVPTLAAAQSKAGMKTDDGGAQSNEKHKPKKVAHPRKKPVSDPALLKVDTTQNNNFSTLRTDLRPDKEVSKETATDKGGDKGGDKGKPEPHPSETPKGK